MSTSPLLCLLLENADHFEQLKGSAFLFLRLDLAYRDDFCKQISTIFYTYERDKKHYIHTYIEKSLKKLSTYICTSKLETLCHGAMCMCYNE